jgi:DNA mismatch endonuclease (patch repair protein)
MVDGISPEKRSWNMSQIRSKDTKPELYVRSSLHRMGYRFSLNGKVLPGKPDILLPRYKIAIFVHGCFWHRHARCKYAYTPKSRIEFWNHKFEGNRQRDREIARRFRRLIWECEVVKSAWLTRLAKLTGRHLAPQSHA